MPLNNSGPLSFGGSTVGQSINLELGLSATATASINSTAFRTLAGVPSGQISVSNFYGKSNTYGWVAFLGISGQNVGSSPTLGDSSAFVDSQGNAYWRYRGDTSANGQFSQSAIAVMNKDATLLTFNRPFFTGPLGGPGFVPTALWQCRTLFPSAGRFLVSGSESDLNNYPTFALDSSLNRISPNQGIFGVGLRNVAVTPNGTVYAARGGVGRLDASSLILNANFGVQTGLQTYYEDSVRVAPRSDNTGVIFAKSADTIYWGSIPSTGTSFSGFQVSYTSDGGQGAGSNAAVDSSNAVFFVNNRGWLFRISTANTVLIQRNSSAQSDPAHVAAHGSVVYTAKGSDGVLQLRAFNSTTLAPLWQNTITFGDPGAGPLYIAANAEGLFIHMYSSDSRLYFIKLPLTGFPSGGSQLISGAGKTMTWTVGTFGSDPITPGTVTSATMTSSTQNPSTPGNFTGAGAATPVNTKTDLA